MQCRIAKIIHLGLSGRISAADDLIENSEMCQASNTAATDHVCPILVAILTERFDVVEQLLRELLERFQRLIARLSPGPGFDTWSRAA